MVHTTLNLVPDEADGPGGSGAGGAIAYTSGAPAENVAAGCEWSCNLRSRNTVNGELSLQMEQQTVTREWQVYLPRITI